jgi:hypothetical protein
LSRHKVCKTIDTGSRDKLEPRVVVSLGSSFVFLCLPRFEIG